MLSSMAAVALGGALGSLLRWVLSTRYNNVLPALPLGTLASNLIAGYVIGVSIAYLGKHADLAPQWRLFVITGLMGGLSTFSTFSAEITAHLQAGRIGWAVSEAAIHLAGSVLMTLAGLASVAWLRR
ncbi:MULTISPECIES: fluoride efflux transporter CrcB [Burkholderiaceae]|uniref:fluoride efflux transporter CrcB n=1 Tax=Burkholderiaceae TaxID=119060 RepID=UPI0009687145|nr:MULTISPECIES: fluoride efflux transporter CrcB [Burkholderiaceae]MCF2133111.1 fluoride efflux transporter CrcB [Mycetohabitans sp. B3]MCG1038564.1 fluoride efflux transporter CrcB [Mycetohabitans sp. B7]SIT80745.1 camphor resistance protein CrcB [Burkholderia sp. b14]